MTDNNFLQIDPSHFSTTTTRHYDELPENFLETVSPHASQSVSSLPISGHDGAGAHHSNIGMTLANDFYSYGNILTVPGQSSYPILKTEIMDPITNPIRLTQNPLEKLHRYSGQAGILPPLQHDVSRCDNNLLGIVRTNGRASEMLNSLRTTQVHPCVKEEISTEFPFTQTMESYVCNTAGIDPTFLLHQPTQREYERMNAATPPAISGDMMSPLDNNEVLYDIQGSQPYVTQPSPSVVRHQPPVITTTTPAAPPPTRRIRKARHAKNNNASNNGFGQATATATAIDHHSQDISAPGGGGGGGGGVADGIIPPPRTVYSTTDASDPLNAEIDDDIYIDTKDLCARIAYELKQHSIPQAIFAERILCRSQGTLSDLLRNPKPWNRLKSGRETFKRMYNWIQLPLNVRLGILDMYKGPTGSTSEYSGPTGSTNNNQQQNLAVMTQPLPAPNARQHTRSRSSNNDGSGSATKRPRLVFTDIQKRTLQAIFKETQRPSREMQQTIAEHLRLDMSTVSNFFMNARRRSRNGHALEDEPTPYQQIRQITPPPSNTLPVATRNPSSRSRSYKSSSNASGHAMSEHIEAAVAAVAHGTSSMGDYDTSGNVALDDGTVSNDGTYGGDMLSGSILAEDDDNAWADTTLDVKPSMNEYTVGEEDDDGDEDDDDIDGHHVADDDDEDDGDGNDLDDDEDDEDGSGRSEDEDLDDEGVDGQHATATA